MATTESDTTGLRWRKAAPGAIKTRRSEKSNVGDEEDDGEALSPGARLFHEPNFNVYIIAIMGCKTDIQPHIVKANLPNALLRHPRFSSLQVVDENSKQMKWVRTEVDLEKHVIVPELDPNMDSPDKFVEDYVSNLTKTTIPMSQPLWDLHLLNVETSQAKGIGVFRIHHSLGDGTSLMSLLLACCRQISDPVALPTIPVHKKKERPGTSYGFLGRCVVAAWWFLVLIWNTIVDVFVFMLTTMYLKDSLTAIKGPEGVELMPRRFVWRSVSLDDMKLIKNALNTTVTDVALGVTEAGLSQYLNRIYGKIENPGEEFEEGKNYLPKKLRFRSTLLINIRPAAGIQALADMMEKESKAKWGNWIGFVLVPFTLAMRDDPLDYVRNAKVTVDRKKHSLEAIFTCFISETVLKLFGVKVASALSHRVISNTTMCFSSLVGPQERIGFYGHEGVFLAPGSCNQPHALMINFQSHADKMTIVLSVDEGTIPDPHQLLSDIVESLDLIRDAALSKDK